MEPVIQTVDELLNEALPPAYYLVRPILPSGGSLLISGDPKAGKSFFALNMGMQMASGSMVLNRWQSSKAMSVLYIEMEIGKFRMHERCGKVFLADVVARHNMRVITRDMRIQLDTREGFELFRKAIEKVVPDVVILDPIIEFHSQEENSSVAMKTMLRPARMLLQQLNTALIIVHHNAKRSEFRPGNNAMSARGAYLTGMVDTVISLERPIETQPVVRAHFTLRSDEAPYPAVFRFDKDTGVFNPA